MERAEVGCPRLVEALEVRFLANRDANLHFGLLTDFADAAEEAQAFLGEGVRVVSAFQNVSAVHLKDPDHPIDCDVLVTGDDPAARQWLAVLMNDLDAILAQLSATGAAAYAAPVHDESAAEALSPQQQLDEALSFCESAQELWKKGELKNALESLDHLSSTQLYALIVISTIVVTLTVLPNGPAADLAPPPVPEQGQAGETGLIGLVPLPEVLPTEGLPHAVESPLHGPVRHHALHLRRLSSSGEDRNQAYEEQKHGHNRKCFFHWIPPCVITF